MGRHRRMVGLVLALAALGSLPAAAPRAAAAPGGAPTVTMGTVAGVSGSTLTLTAGGTQKTVAVGPDTFIVEREPATLSSLTPGAAAGVDAKRGPDGSLTAVSIHVFSPEIWARARKGQWLMDSGDVMTNAVVTAFVERVEAHTLYMKYDQGTATIAVPPSTEIYLLRPARLADLVPGAAVTVRGTPGAGGTINASSITINRKP